MIRLRFSLRNVEVHEVNTIRLLWAMIWPSLRPYFSSPSRLVRLPVSILRVLWTQGLGGLRDALVQRADQVGVIQGTHELDLWFAHYRLKPADIERLKNLSWPEHSPCFSVIVSIKETSQNRLERALESVRDQTYPKWELICIIGTSSSTRISPTLQRLAEADARIHIETTQEQLEASAALKKALTQAAGDYVCFLESGDRLEPHALHRFAEVVLADKPDLIYSDMVGADEPLGHITEVVARPAFSWDHYLSHPRVLHFLAIRADLIKAVSHADAKPEGLDELELILRVLERSQTISHVPDVLYWRGKHAPDASKAPETEATVSGLRGHLRRLGFSCEVRPGTGHGIFDIRFFETAPARVAIVIPTKNRGDLLRRCVGSLFATTDPGCFVLYIVDHESDDPSTRTYLEELSKKKYCTVIKYTENFNFSRINNFAVSKIKSNYGYYLFMNNDIECLDPGWFESMLDKARRGDIGVVGATLLYPDRSVQHAGVIIGIYGAAEHAHKGVPFYNADGTRSPGYDDALLTTREYSAVTAACMMMPAELFHELGGFEETLRVGFNDTDLCLRARARGYKVINDAYAVLLHHESATRGQSGSDPHPDDTARFVSRQRVAIETGDPFFNPLLSTWTPRFRLSWAARCRTQTRWRTVRNFLPSPISR